MPPHRPPVTVRRTLFRPLTALIAITALATGLPAPAAQAAPAFPAECPWMDTTKTAGQRARLLLDASSPEQKMRWLDEQSATRPTETAFDGVRYPAQLPCTPSITYTDGPDGVRGSTGVTAFPAPISLASTWNDRLSQVKGRAQAEEAFDKGKAVVLAPGIASGRTPLAGRNSEYLGEDPLLSGRLAGAGIRGLQTGNAAKPTLAVLKHYVANEQELDRTLSSSNIDERTLRQVYDLPFEIAIGDGRPGGVMCSYNQINGVYACENPLLRNVLKTTLGFDGFVVSDFWAVHSTAPSLNAGLDQELNKPLYFTPERLTAALNAGQITQAQIDQAAFRVVRAYIRAGLFDHPVPSTPADDVSTAAHKAVSLDVATQGSVLLKNQGDILPLKPDRQKIAVIGPTASSTPTDGISASTVCASLFFGQPSVSCPSPVAAVDAITRRAAQNGGTVTFDNGKDHAAAATAARSADVAIVFGHYTEGEFADRPDLRLDAGGDALISAVAAANPNTVVVLQTGSAVLMPWKDEVKAVLETWYAGDQQGTAIARLLWGDANPSGKLPMTFPKSLADTPTRTPRQYPGTFPDGSTTRPGGDETTIRQVDYTEGLKVGYKWYDAQGIEPLYPFGYGLSYTRYRYEGLRVTPKGTGDVQVRFRLSNVGARAGTETAQVYLTLPPKSGEPGKRLVAYARAELKPGQAQVVNLTIKAADPGHPFSVWNPATDAWTTPKGTYTVSVGSSSRNLPLTATLTR
ncbi:beta-glucosidase [Actinomadura fibrosa]|uniref:Glycoside hydrolase family 3 C-terminal domain-containing protein n=1 Tax=Actinomadura fibrosa TaxID=111802 RepID=A0ABW2XPP3_9ACTN|nr:glycoside hydrolase family 3 C-terminal domain-containing protein [Actinomadura fibrosa]